MWNQIRGPGFMGSGSTINAYFQGDFGSQYAIESQLIAGLCKYNLPICD